MTQIPLPKQWYHDKAAFVRELEEHGSFVEIQNVHGTKRNTLADWRIKHGLPKGMAGPQAREVIGSEISETDMLRQRVRELEAARSSGRKEDILRERMVAALNIAVRQKEPSYSPLVIARPRKVDEHEMALLWSDTHAGEVITREEVNGLNAYNWEEMMRRHDELLRGVLSYRENRPYPVRKLHVWALGDMLSGKIHEELAETNEFPIIECAVQFGLDGGEWLERFVPEFETINFAGVVGNHPRLTQKPRAKTKYDNFDWLVYHTMQQRLRGVGSIHWEIPKAQKWPIELCRRRVLLTHGDGIRSSMVGVPWGGLIRHTARLSNEYARAAMPIDHFLFGHFHSAAVVENRRIIVNGSMKGVDEYALERFGSGEPAHQVLLTFHPKRGLTDASFLDLQQ